MYEHKVAVLLTTEELVRIKQAAGLAKLSAWIRHVALAAADGERELPGTRSPAPQNTAAALPDDKEDWSPEPVKKPKKGKAPESLLCPHGALPKLCKHEKCRGF